MSEPEQSPRGRREQGSARKTESAALSGWPQDIFSGPQRLIRWTEFLVVAAFLIGSRAVLLGRAHFIEDPEYWYAVYHFFARGFYNGAIQLWDPFMNGGEPLWPAFGLFRLFDPLNQAFLLVGRALGISLFFLYHFQFIVKYMISMAGLYLLLRRLTKSPAACLLATTLVSISIFWGLTDARYMVFCWIPFILYFFTKALEDGRLSDLGWAAYFTGLYVGAANYHVAEGTFYLLCFGAGTFAWNRDQWRVLLGRMKERKLATVLAVLALMSTTLPLIAAFRETTSGLHPIGRTSLERNLFEQPDNHSPSYARTMRWGGALTPLGLYNALAPAHAGTSWPSTRYTPSGVYNSLSLRRNLAAFPLLILGLASFGLIFGRGPWKGHFILATAISTFMALGAQTPVHRFFYELY